MAFAFFGDLLSGKKRMMDFRSRGLPASSHKCGGNERLIELLYLGSVSLWQSSGCSIRLS